MLKHFKTVRVIAKEIAEAANSAFSSYQDGRATEEPQITDRIIGAIEDRIQSQQFENVVWKARTLRTSRGKAAEEKRHGADLMGVLDVNLPGYATRKGFLAQAKKAEPHSALSTTDWDRLRCQCTTMLDRTPDSFVFIYSRARGIRIFPAISVLGLTSRNIFDLYDRSVSTFFEYHIQCYIGDTRLNSTDIETIDVLADFSAERILHLSATQSQ